LLFSATISAEVKDFTLAGIKDYRMITVDRDNKLSELLKIHFFIVRSHEKEAALIYTMRERVKINEQTIVFGATRYHVEYLCELAIKCGFKANFIYGAMDQYTREEKLREFRKRSVNFMFVTDLAARGIDIPFLENVIHYDFPTRMKLFIHRAGRTARAGRKGTSWGVVTNEELPYLHDLSIFTGKDRMDVCKPEQLNDPNIITFGKLP
jgi:ATP-dependent RNA helicase DDX54/DBP10